MKFPVYLEYDLEYEGYVVDCPTLPGCMSQGKTKEEALTNIKEAIELYLEVAKEKKKLPVQINYEVYGDKEFRKMLIDDKLPENLAKTAANFWSDLGCGRMQIET